MKRYAKNSGAALRRFPAIHEKSGGVAKIFLPHPGEGCRARAGRWGGVMQPPMSFSELAAEPLGGPG